VRDWFGGAQFTVTLLQKCRDWRRRAQPKPIERGSSDLRPGALARTNGVAAAGPSARPLGRGGGIRTPDFELPKLALYQPELHPEAANPNTRFCARDCLCVAPQFTRGYHDAVSQNPRAMPQRPSRAIKPPVHQPSSSRIRDRGSAMGGDSGPLVRQHATHAVRAPRFRSAPGLCTQRHIE
jgi:hypothetical protein